jgi:hypothetical protein
MERDLFEHLVAEFGDRGRDAVRFLETAQQLVAASAAGHLPRGAGAAAYCIREALKRLLPPESARLSWRTLSDAVVDARQRFESVRGLPGTDEVGALEELLAAINRLGEFKHSEQGQHQRRLAELVELRTGVQPLTIVIREYQRLLRELDSDAVHSHASLEQVRALLDRALTVLAAVFAPFQLRRPELESLAQLPHPDEDSVKRLLSLCSTPHHLSYFMQHAISHEWLSLLTPLGILDPPQEGGAWPVLYFVERQAPQHSDEIARWLEEVYRAWGRSEVGAAYVAAAARECLPAASTILLHALRDYPGSTWIRGQAARALEVMDVADPFIEAAADVLLDPDDAAVLAGVAHRIVKCLMEGMTPENAEARVALIAGKLSVGSANRYLAVAATTRGSVEDVAEDEGRGAGLLVKAVLTAVRRAREVGIQTERVLALLQPVPGRLLARLRVWTLCEATDVQPQTLVIEVARAIQNRNPTGDDVRLVQRIVTELSPDVYLDAWRAAMGIPPLPEDVGRSLASDDVPQEWYRAYFWHPVLPDTVREAWDTVVVLISGDHPAPRPEEYLRPAPRRDVGVARSPMTANELRQLDMREAAKRISAWRPAGDRMTLARELARSLEEVVASDACDWASRPLEILALLRHATYAHHYLEGLAKSPEDLAGLGPALVEAVSFARTHPWNPEELGNDDFDYDPTWEPVDDAGVKLIGKLAERDVDLGDRYDDAWRIVLAAARDRSRASSISRDDPLATAINRPCTKAFAAMFQLLATEFRRSQRVRGEAIELLDEALDLDSWEGAEHRAIIAPRIGFLQHVAPTWVESRDAKLFGDGAPDDLGQQTVELALKWGRPNRWLLERHSRAVRRAVRQGSKEALDQFLVAMLWEIPGYSAQETLRALVPMGAAVVSQAAELLARLLMSDVDSDYVARGTLFWRNAVAEPALPPAAFRGFGWWAEVKQIPGDEWEQMMSATCERAEGTLDWCVEVAERCALEPITAMGLEIITKLLRGRHEPWDRSQIAETGLRALRTSAADSALSEPRERLRSALTDLGHFGAADM